MSRMKAQYYAVAVGRQAGIYHTWSDCESQVKGYPKARYKKFNTKHEAQMFMDTNACKSGGCGLASGSKIAHNVRMVDEVRKNVPAVRSCLGKRSAAQAIDRLDEWRNAPVVYTDGSCLGNGKRRPKAGYGVYWGENHPENVSAPLQEGIATNNRAELTAVISALQSAIKRKLQRIVVCTDSQLLIKTMNQWIGHWRRNGWKTSTGGDVKNRDLIVQLDKLLQQVQVKFEHVAGHAGIFGNERADQLARAGASDCSDLRQF